LSRLFDSIAGSPRVTRMLGQVQTRPRWRRLYLAIAGNRKEFGRFAKFATVGTVGTVVDFSVLNLLILGFGLTKFWANTWSFSAAVLSNFVWNRLWTFPESRERPLVPQLAQFGLVSVGGYVINQVIFLGLDALVFHVWGTLGYNISKAIAILVVLFWNFGINRIWTYRGIS
jgi:putative flippase GtrA